MNQTKPNLCTMLVCVGRVDHHLFCLVRSIVGSLKSITGGELWHVITVEVVSPCCCCGGDDDTVSLASILPVAETIGRIRAIR